MDVYGHVNHANVVTLLEEARVPVLFGEAERAGLTELPKGVVVVKLGVHYRAPIVAAPGRSVRVEITLTELKASTVTLGYVVRTGPDATDPVAVTAETVLAPYDTANLRPRLPATRNPNSSSGCWPMPELRIPDPGDRETLSAFVARAVRLDGTTAVRLRRRGDDVVEAWTATPFEVLATRAVAGTVTPADVTVSGNELLAALAVAGGEVMDPGPARDLLWHAELPVSDRWQKVDELPVGVVSDLADRGVALARDNAGPHGTPPASLMDQAVLTVTGETSRSRSRCGACSRCPGWGCSTRRSTATWCA